VRKITPSFKGFATPRNGQIWAKTKIFSENFVQSQKFLQDNFLIKYIGIMVK